MARHGTWTETSSGSGDALVVIVAVVVPCVVACAAALAVAKTVASIPAYVWVLATVVIVTGIAAGVRVMVRSHRRQAAAFAARHAEMATAGEARLALAREHRAEERQHQLAVAAAQAPVIHNHVYTTPAAIAAAPRNYAPTVVVPAADKEEIRR